MAKLRHSIRHNSPAKALRAVLSTKGLAQASSRRSLAALQLKMHVDTTQACKKSVSVAARNKRVKALTIELNASSHS